VYGDLSILFARTLTEERFGHSARHSVTQRTQERVERTAAPARVRIRAAFARVR